MLKRRLNQVLGAAALSVAVAACQTPKLVQKTENRTVPTAYVGSSANDSTSNAGRVQWRAFFTDPNLVSLIDSALQRNQELNITRQEIELAQQEIRARKGEYLPSVGLGAQAAADRVGRYTLQGATEEKVDIRERHTPDPLTNFQVGAFATWEVDIWHKLRNARQAAVSRYLASVEGRNFTTTNLVAEIATSYYELLALDNQLAILQQNIRIQRNALEAVKLQKEAARVTELAVQRFEAQVQNTTARQYVIQQRITETENRINFLAGRYPQPVKRTTTPFTDILPKAVQGGIPAQLLQNRPDIRQAEQNLAAAKLDVTVARANFYPRLSIDASVGLQAFRPDLLVNAPESILLTLAGNAIAPLINRNGIKALYYSANARQTQAVYEYERTILSGYIEVANQLSNIRNLEQSYDAKTKEVQALTQSTTIAGNLFGSARADYTEVLFTQRDVLEARFDQIETRLQQLNATVNVYRALGGGWR